MLSEIETRIVKTFANVSGIPFEMLGKKLLSNREANTYPYWLFNSKRVEGNMVELSASEQVISRHVGYVEGVDLPVKNDQINRFAGKLAYGKKFDLYPQLKPVCEGSDYLHNGELVNVWTQGRGGIVPLPPHTEMLCLFLGDFTESWVFEFKGWIVSGSLVLEFPRRNDGEKEFSES